MATGCSLNPALRHQEGATSWCSTRRARNRCINRNCEGIHDRFLRDPGFCDAQFQIGWNEEKCIAMDKLVQEDHSYNLSREEYLRYQKHWYLTLNKSGKNAPMRLRSEFRAAVTLMSRLHRELGEERAEHIPFQQYQRWHLSSSSSSWWNWARQLVEFIRRIHFS